MATMWEGLVSSRRRPARSRSESGKQLHARWGDAAISAPGGGWSQQFADDDLNNPVYQAHGSPDSQKTLVNNSPDLSFTQEKIEQVVVEEIRASTPPAQKERSAITITIPLPWSRKTHRRSSSGASHPAQFARPTERVITAESRPALGSLLANIDQIIVPEQRPATVEPYTTISPILQAQSPVYDDVSTYFTRAAFPEKPYGLSRLPQIQTSVPINKSQPASAISILSPVAEKYNGLSESNNGTPLDNTPIATRNERELPPPTLPPVSDEGVINIEALKSRLETYARTSPPIQPPSRITSPINASDPDFGRQYFDNTRTPSRPASRGPGIGEVAYMRASSRGAVDQPRSASRGAVDQQRSTSRGPGSRSASRDPVSRRTGSVEPYRRRADSVEAFHRRAESREPHGRRSASRGSAMDDERVGRSRSRDYEPVTWSRNESPAPVTARRTRSRNPTPFREPSREPTTHRNVSLDPPSAILRASSPERIALRANSRDPFPRRAISRDPVKRTRRISAEFPRRAISVDPIVRRASPREDIITISRHGTPVPASRPFLTNAAESSDELDLTSADETTDIETETDEMYFESRKGWNGPATDGGVKSKGFYGDITQDYKAINNVIEADNAISISAPTLSIDQLPPNVGGAIVNYVTKAMDVEPEGRKRSKYAGPDLVPSHEELWG